MPQKVYSNVVGQRLIDNGRVAEDVQKIGLPTLEHPTNTVKASGMAMEVDMPDMTRYKAMEFTVEHNNGINCKYLGSPGKHLLEGRVARQNYDVAAGDAGHESVKWRLTGLHKSTDKGSIEEGNPYGSTEKYSLLRFEEEIAGEIVTIIDAMAGIIKINGVDYTNAVENLLA
jgi:P2 family phage contractile tail tube protein